MSAPRRLPAVATTTDNATAKVGKTENANPYREILDALGQYGETLRHLAELAAEGVEPPKLERREVGK